MHELVVICSCDISRRETDIKPVGAENKPLKKEKDVERKETLNEAAVMDGWE